MEIEITFFGKIEIWKKNFEKPNPIPVWTCLTVVGLLPTWFTSGRSGLGWLWLLQLIARRLCTRGDKEGGKWDKIASGFPCPLHRSTTSWPESGSEEVSPPLAHLSCHPSAPPVWIESGSDGSFWPDCHPSLWYFNFRKREKLCKRTLGYLHGKPLLGY